MAASIEARGDLAVQAKKFQDAVDLFSRLLDRLPDSQIIRFKTARALFCNGEEERALHVLKPIIDNPHAEISIEFGNMMLWVLIICGRFSWTKIIMQRMRKQYPFQGATFERILEDYGSACDHYQLKNWYEASEILQRMTFFGEQCADILALLADCKFELKERKKAFEFARQALSKKPSHPLANCLCRLHDMIEKQEEQCDIEFPTTPVHSQTELHVHLVNEALVRRRQQLRSGLHRAEGLMHWEQKNYRAAIESFTREVDNATDRRKVVDCLLLRAKCHYFLFQTDKAQEDLDILRSVCPESRDRLKLLLLVSIRKGDIAASRELVNQLDPNEPEVQWFNQYLENFEICRKRLEDEEYASGQYLLTCITDFTYGINYQLFGMLAVCCYMNESHIRAKQWCEKSLQLKSADNAEGSFAKGLILLHEEQYEEALRWLNRARENKNVQQYIDIAQSKLQGTNTNTDQEQSVPKTKRPTEPTTTTGQKTKRPRAEPTTTTGQKPPQVIDTTQNYYEFLQVDPKAPKAVLKKQINDLLKKHHPDKSQTGKETEGITQHLLTVRETLLDDDKRRKYDFEQAKRQK